MNNVKPLPLAMGETHHILALSGGKDSTALAIYMRDKVRQMKYVFCDTGYELKETYDYLKRVEAFLGKPITRLTPDGITFDDLLEMRNGFLPSPQVRWCTEHLKIKPYEKYIGDAKVISYVGIRSDESHRQGYISSKPNITTIFPFVEDNLVRSDIIRILENSTFRDGRKLGLPKYYEWRSRSGCFFCFLFDLSLFQWSRFCKFEDKVCCLDCAQEEWCPIG